MIIILPRRDRTKFQFLRYAANGLVAVAVVLLIDGCSKEGPPPPAAGSLPAKTSAPPVVNPDAIYADETEDRIYPVEDFFNEFGTQIALLSAGGLEHFYSENFSGEPLFAPDKSSERAISGITFTKLVSSGKKVGRAGIVASFRDFCKTIRGVRNCTGVVKGARFDGGKWTVTAEIELDAATEEGEVCFRDTYELVLEGGEISGQKRISGRKALCAAPMYEDVTQSIGLDLPIIPPRAERAVFMDPYSLVGGIAAADFDGDGRTDLCVPRFGSPLLFKSTGGKFEDVTQKAGLNGTDMYSAVLCRDFNGDKKPDILIAAYEPEFVSAAEATGMGGLVKNQKGRAVTLYVNNGDGTFADATEKAGLKCLGPATAMCAADVDNDGDLDFYVCMYREFRSFEATNLYPLPENPANARSGAKNLFFLNRGNGTFDECGGKFGIDDSGWSLAAEFGDYDGDGFADLYLANDYGDNRLFHNIGGKKFEDVTAASGTADKGFGMGVTWFDYDHDGKNDVYVSNMYSHAGLRILERGKGKMGDDRYAAAMKMVRGNTLLRNLGNGKFEDVSEKAGVNRAGWAWGNITLDANGDGLPDLYVANGFISGETNRDIDNSFWRFIKTAIQYPPSEFPSSQETVYQLFRSRVQSALLEMMNNPAAITARDNLKKIDATLVSLAPAISFAGHQRNPLFLNMGDGTFEECACVLGLGRLEDGRTAISCDIDNDGQEDVIIHNYYKKPVMVLRKGKPNPPPVAAIRDGSKIDGVDGKAVVLWLPNSKSELTKFILTRNAEKIRKAGKLVIFAESRKAIDELDMYMKYIPLSTDGATVWNGEFPSTDITVGLTDDTGTFCALSSGVSAMRLLK